MEIRKFNGKLYFLCSVKNNRDQGHSQDSVKNNKIFSENSWYLLTADYICKKLRHRC